MKNNNINSNSIQLNKYIYKLNNQIKLKANKSNEKKI